MPRVLLSDADSDYLEALRDRLASRLSTVRPDVAVGTLPLAAAEPGSASCDLLVYNPDDLPEADAWEVVRAGRALRLIPGGVGSLRDGTADRLGGVGRILAETLRLLPPEASGNPASEGDADPHGVRCVCLLASLPASIRQALSLSAAEALSGQGFDVDHLDLTPIDPEGYGLPVSGLAPLPDALPSVSDLLLGADAWPRPVRAGGPAFVLPPRRADDLSDSPPALVGDAVRRLSARPADRMRLVLAACGEVPFSLVREVAAACGRVLLLHGPGAGAAVRALRREMALMLPDLPPDVRFSELVLPLDPLRPTVSGWTESVARLTAALASDGEARRGADA